MMKDCAGPDVIRSAQAECQARLQAHKQHCILLAVVTSPDVAATLIDQAIALRAREKAIATSAPSLVDA
jgi:hypothetical protein